jgi:hypothetical protein
MKKFIAYFDLLGYKQFITNNDHNEVRRRIMHIMRDMETALSEDSFKESKFGHVVADMSKSNINCINISDTILFWTNDDSFESFQEFIRVVYRYNWNGILFNFAARGSLVFDEIEVIAHRLDNEGGGTYNVNPMFGKGLVNAHLKAESQNWAGCVIDKSVIEELQKHTEVEHFLEPYAIKYQVPYKKGLEVSEQEFVLKIIKGNLNSAAYTNTKRGIEDNFASDNKDVSNIRVQELLANTVRFLDVFKEAL